MPRVVGADHEHDRLRLVAVEFSVVDTPQHVLGAVGAEAEVERPVGALGEVLLPHEPALILPVVRDGVAEKHDRRAARLHELLLLGEALRPPALLPLAVRLHRIRRSKRERIAGCESDYYRHQQPSFHIITFHF
jgi:hypothetical protein